MIFLTNLNLSNNELQNAVIQPLSAAPSTGVTGKIYYNTTEFLVYVYDGTSWNPVGSPYSLPTMSITTKGGAILGNGLVVSDSTLSLGTPSTLTPTTTNSVSGTTHTHAITGFEPTINLTPSMAVVSDSGGALSVSSVSSTELAYVHGVTSAIQTQLNGKQVTITGAATTITASDLTASRALVSDTNGKVGVSTVTTTELGYLSGVTGAIQTQIDSIPRYNYLTGLSTSATLDPSTATQNDIDTVAIPVIQAAYTSPSKWDATVMSFTFLPSDIKKDLMYYYNGTAWTFLYYVTTGVQLANGTTAGIIQEANSDSDISLAAGVGTVNTSTKLRTNRGFSVTGEATAASVNFNGTAAVSLNITALNVSDKEVAIASGDGLIISDSSNSNNLAESTLKFGSSTSQFLANNGSWQNPSTSDEKVTSNELGSGTSVEYPVLTQDSATTGSVNGQAGKSSNVTINPSTNTLTAPIFSGALTGNASTATVLQTGRTIGISGGATGTATSFNGSANIAIPVTALDPTYLSSAVPVSKGGTGSVSLTSGQVLVGNGTSAVSTRAIDTTSGGTTGSTSLITSGAVYSGIAAVSALIPSAVSRTVLTMTTSVSTITSGTINGYILSVLVVDSVTKVQVYTDVGFSNPTGSSGTVTITCSSVPTNDLSIIITSIAA